MSISSGNALALSFPGIETLQVVEILPHEREGPTYLTGIADGPVTLGSRASAALMLI